MDQVLQQDSINLLNENKIVTQKMRVYKQCIIVYHLIKSKYSAESTPLSN